MGNVQTQLGLYFKYFCLWKYTYTWNRIEGYNFISTDPNIIHKMLEADSILKLKQQRATEVQFTYILEVKHFLSKHS